MYAIQVEDDGLYYGSQLPIGFHFPAYSGGGWHRSAQTVSIAADTLSVYAISGVHRLTYLNKSQVTSHKSQVKRKIYTWNEYKYLKFQIERLQTSMSYLKYLK